VAALVELRCETDFVAKAAEFVAVADDLAALVTSKGEGAIAERSDEIERLAVTLKENISVGRVYRLEAKAGEVIDTYLHQQSGRGVNAVAVVLKGGTAELAHEVALTAAFSRPSYVRREEVPEAEVAAERQTLEALSRNEGKPEAALPKIVEGRLTGWFKERVLLEQPSAHDDKQTVGAMLGSADIVAFAQVVIGT
jgi:elongation factor Ts